MSDDDAAGAGPGMDRARSERVGLPPQPIRSGKLGCLAGGIAGILLLAALSIPTGGASFLCAAPLVFLAAGAWWWSKRFRAPTVEQTLARDPRPPVVYLRSFDLDSDISRTAQRRLNRHIPDVINRPLEGFANIAPLKAIDRWTGQTVEDRLVKELKRIGPVIAIGRPGETAPLPGATRLYVGDDWQDRIHAMMKSASLVVIRPWISQGVLWEIKAALEICDPRRVVLIFWEIPDEKYEAFRDAAAGVVDLPPVTARSGEELVLFDQNRKARLAPIPRRGPIGTLLVDAIDLNAAVGVIMANIVTGIAAKHP
ncbi:MAG: hypothetical protein KF787_01140 [Phycisphaeraceae bacterium]|nr:hypothetical protein [Phycisphaerae bacterium]MBX3391228.1 hypothetical protein [Phycisphaeraceae bacterium]